MALPLIEPTLTHRHIGGMTKLLGMFSFAAGHMFLESLDSGEHNSPPHPMGCSRIRQDKLLEAFIVNDDRLPVWSDDHFPPRHCSFAAFYFWLYRPEI